MRQAKMARAGAAAADQIPAGATHAATLGGETRYMSAANMTAVMDGLMADFPNAGVPAVSPIGDRAFAQPASERRPVAQQDHGSLPGILAVLGATAVLGDGTVVEPDAPAFSSFGGELVIDQAAKERIEGQREVLASRGVVVDEGQQFFATGTRMAKEGYAYQEQRKAEHEAKIPLFEAAGALTQRVESEGREDVEVSAREFADALTVNGKVKAFGLSLREQAIRGLLFRTERPALSYVLGLRERIVAEVRKDAPNRAAIEGDKAKIADVLRHECLRNPDAKLKLRTRKAVGDIFTVVSPSYAVADAPQALAKLLDGLPGDAKGTYAYDPATTTWELRASVWTPTLVAEQAVGEAFEGYASFWSKDDGTGSFRGGGGAIFLRCLNASTFSANSTDVRRRHVGDVLGDVKGLLAASLAAVDALCEAWGTARKEEVRMEGDLYAGMPVSQLISGIFFAELRNAKSDLAGVLPGRSSEHAKNLATVFASERRDAERLVRSDFGQAWTRYIQDQPAPVRREGESAVGSWLLDPRPMRYEALRA